MCRELMEILEIRSGNGFGGEICLFSELFDNF